MSVILIVEDNRIALRMVALILDRAGYDTVETTSPADALEVVQSQTVDLAIVDMGLPGMNGIELLRALRERNAALPVMMLTADGNPNTCDQALAAGASLFLNKPLSSIELLMAVSKLLDH